MGSRKSPAWQKFSWFMPAIRTARKSEDGNLRCITVGAGGSSFAERTIGTRMDDFAKTPRPIASEISEVARDGLILWRLTTSGDRDLWCLVFETSVGFLLVVEDHPEGTEPPRISERHADVIALVNRTDCLKDALLRDGWTEVDVD